METVVLERFRDIRFGTGVFEIRWTNKNQL